MRTLGFQLFSFLWIFSLSSSSFAIPTFDEVVKNYLSGGPSLTQKQDGWHDVYYYVGQGGSTHSGLKLLLQDVKTNLESRSWQLLGQFEIRNTTTDEQELFVQALVNYMKAKKRLPVHRSLGGREWNDLIVNSKNPETIDGLMAVISGGNAEDVLWKLTSDPKLTKLLSPEQMRIYVDATAKDGLSEKRTYLIESLMFRPDLWKLFPPEVIDWATRYTINLALRNPHYHSSAILLRVNELRDRMTDDELKSFVETYYKKNKSGYERDIVTKIVATDIRTRNLVSHDLRDASVKSMARKIAVDFERYAGDKFLTENPLVISELRQVIDKNDKDHNLPISAAAAVIKNPELVKSLGQNSIRLLLEDSGREVASLLTWKEYDREANIAKLNGLLENETFAAGVLGSESFRDPEREITFVLQYPQYWKLLSPRQKVGAIETALKAHFKNEEIEVYGSFLAIEAVKSAPEFATASFALMGHQPNEKLAPFLVTNESIISGADDQSKGRIAQVLISSALAGNEVVKSYLEKNPELGSSVGALLLLMSQAKRDPNALKYILSTTSVREKLTDKDWVSIIEPVVSEALRGDRIALTTLAETSELRLKMNLVQIKTFIAFLTELSETEGWARELIGKMPELEPAFSAHLDFISEVKKVLLQGGSCGI